MSQLHGGLCELRSSDAEASWCDVPGVSEKARAES